MSGEAASTPPSGGSLSARDASRYSARRLQALDQRSGEVDGHLVLNVALTLLTRSGLTALPSGTGNCDLHRRVYPECKETYELIHKAMLSLDLRRTVRAAIRRRYCTWRD